MRPLSDYQDTLGCDPRRVAFASARTFKRGVAYLLQFADDYFTDHCVYGPEIPSEAGLRAYLATMHEAATVGDELEDNVEPDDFEDMATEAARLAWKARDVAC